jgi:glycosyltransferase involved in cell wall biosynthesis
MKKILFLIFNLDGGGAEKVLSDIVINLDKSKYKITVMTKYDSGVYIEDIKNHARYTPCFRRLVPGNNILKKTLNEIILNIREIILNLPGKLVYKIFIRDHYDIEIAFLEGWATKFISGSCSNKSSKIAWIHTDMVSNPYADMSFKDFEAHRKSYTKFNKIICVSETCKLAFVNKFMISDNIYVLQNPINESNINSISSEEINDVEITNKFKIVSVGRLIPEKGYDRLLEIHKKLIND